MAAWWVRIDLLQNYFAIRNVWLRRWQIILTGFSAESIVMSDPPSSGKVSRSYGHHPVNWLTKDFFAFGLGVFLLQCDRLQKLRNDYLDIAVYGFDLSLQPLGSSSDCCCHPAGKRHVPI